MEAQRLSFKLYFRDPDALAPRSVVPVFHSWIRSHALDEVLVDVADYTHVHHGPGVVLVGHGANYAVDLSEGRPGFSYARKRDLPGPFDERLLACCRAALTAAKLLEQEPSLSGAALATGEIVVRLRDRLNAPAGKETAGQVTPGLRGLGERLFAGAPFELGEAPSPDGLFEVRLRGPGGASVAELVARLGAST